MADETLSIPEQGALGDLLGWATAAMEEGDAFLRAQSGYENIDLSIRRVMSDLPELIPSALSKVQSNWFGEIALELASALTDTKTIFEYKTYNKRYESQAEKANKFARSWWLTRQCDQRLLDIMKYSLVAATGYGHITYDNVTDDIALGALDPRDVIPVRPSSTNLVQDGFAQLIRNERTMNWVKQMYPAKASQVKPDRDGFRQAVGRANIISMQGEASGLPESSPYWNSLERKRRTAAEMVIPTVDVMTLYVKDRSRNNSSFTVEVGTKDYPWKYKVPPKGLLYPRLRRIIFTRTAILDDNPSPYWHGLFPLVKFTLDPWPWSYLGKAPMWDCLPLQKEDDRVARALADYIAKFAQPDVVINSQSMSRSELDRINTRLPGLKLRVNPMAGPNPVAFPPPPNVPEWVLKYREGLKEAMYRLSGAADMTALAQLNQMPASDTIEKMMEAMTPLVRMRSRVLEAAMRDMAMMVFSNFCQFYTLPKRLALLGPDGMTFEDFDTDPGSLVPDVIDGLAPDSPREERTRFMLQQFSYHIAPGSLLNASEVSNKMLWFQLWRAGLVDRQSLAEKLDIPNYGSLLNVNPTGDTIIDRLAREAQLMPSPSNSPAGRKATGQEAPHVEQKGDGRQVMSES